MVVVVCVIVIVSVITMTAGGKKIVITNLHQASGWTVNVRCLARPMLMTRQWSEPCSMTPENIEGEAACMLGCDDEEPPDIVRLARRVLGVSVQVVHARALPGDGALVTVHGQRRIYVRSGLPQVRLRWAIAHELGHLALSLDSSCRENEDACDAFAAAILTPMRAYRLALRETGVSYRRLAQWFVASESCVALRLGEVTGQPMALIAPSRVRVRGDDYAWGTEQNVRALAQKTSVAGIRKARLRDDRRRVALSYL